MNNIDKLKTIWAAVYDPKQDVTEVIQKFFHSNYTQCINGLTMNRDEYIEHVIEQKKNMIVDAIDYKYFMENGEKLFALYYPKGKNSEGNDIKAEVIAYFEFKDTGLFRIHGQVHLLIGNPSDVDMND